MLSKIKNLVKKFHNEEDAPTMVEYALMVALIAVVAITAVQLIGTNVTQTFNDIANAL